MTAEEIINGSFELGPIRPPSEAYSLLIRVTRNCPWNRCKFCSIYKGEKFELRSVEEVKQDIRAVKLIQDKIKELAGQRGYGDRLEEVAGIVFNNSPDDASRNVALWLYSGGKSAFLQDANTMIMRTSELVEIIKFLKETLPSIERITSYARSKTVAKKKLEELIELGKAGLSRMHIGLESGYDPVLQFMDKGVTAAEHVTAGSKVVASGILLSEYVVLGLGGRKMWREHALATAKVLNEINPDFIRVRTLSVNKKHLLYAEVQSGEFERQTDEEIVEEEKLLLEHLECSATFVSDHITNLLQEIEGELPQDKNKLLAIIDRFQSLSPEERHNFILGRRTGFYTSLDDLNDLRRRDAVEQMMDRLRQRGSEVDEKLIFSLMENFVS